MRALPRGQGAGAGGGGGGEGWLRAARAQRPPSSLSPTRLRAGGGAAPAAPPASLCVAAAQPAPPLRART